jgi:hypothetical protein
MTPVHRSPGLRTTGPGQRCAWLVRLGLALGLATCAWTRPALAQFGQNKVQYRDFHWRIIETAHFRLHYYEQERESALEASRMAERSYEYLSKFYDHQIEDKIPLILYSNHQDFEQSNVIYGFISEGTGGVTESLKGRVTIPLTGSYGELNHVLTHELVHAFQFDMMERNLRGFLGVGPMPLWMTEGMAEWVSNGMDPVTAMWVIDAVHRGKIPKVAAMATLQDIRVYRMGQALFEVIAKNYGEERVRRILKRPGPGGGSSGRSPRDSLFTPAAEPASLNRNDMATATDSLAFAPGTPSIESLDKLWHTWADSLATKLGSHLVNPDSVAERITEPGKYGRSFHLAPVVSPDGNHILFYSSRGLHNELFVAEKKGDKWESRSLISGEETPGLESLPLLSASTDWSPDGKQVAFVATEEGRDALQIYDVARHKIVKKLKCELFSIANPNYSPDGRYLVFSGLEGGQEDLFLIEVSTGHLTRLTQDAYSERTPRFAPQGDAIVYATDRGPQTDMHALQFGSWNLARMALRTEGDGLAADRVEVLEQSEGNDFAPIWSPDGQTVAFVSDRDGTYQVYSMDIASGVVNRRTHFDSGVLGIIPTGPAFSWGKNGDVVYSVFRNGGWTLYRTHGFPDALPGDADAEKLAMTRSAPAAIQQEAPQSVVETEHPYKTRLTPEYAVLGGLYIGNGGAAGSGQLLLGDMLGNHYLLVSAYLRSQIEQSEFLLQYADLGQRWQWGVAGYQFRDELGLFTAPDSVQYSSMIRAGVQGSVAYPFNRFRRVEFSMDLQTVNNETASLLFSTGQQFATEKRRVYYAIPGVALVKDNAAYSGFTPIAGGRYRISFEQALGNIEYSFGVLDFRRYLNFKTRACLALRFIGAGSEGQDKQWLRIGGPDTFRGADYGQIYGSRIALANAEIRFPIIPTTELLRGVLFLDTATAWQEGQAYQPVRIGGPLGYHLDSVHMAVGFGFRAYVGLPLRFDVALPTDLQRNGDWRTMFAIGYDY